MKDTVSHVLELLGTITGYGIWVLLAGSVLWVVALAGQIYRARKDWGFWATHAAEMAASLRPPEERVARSHRLCSPQGIRVWIEEKCSWNQQPTREGNALACFAETIALEAQTHDFLPSHLDVQDHFHDQHRNITRHLHFLRSGCPFLAILGVCSGVGPFARSLGQAQLDASAFAQSFHATVIGLAVALIAQTLLFWMKGWADNSGRRFMHDVQRLVQYQRECAAFITSQPPQAAVQAFALGTVTTTEGAASVGYPGQGQASAEAESSAPSSTPTRNGLGLRPLLAQAT